MLILSYTEFPLLVLYIHMYMHIIVTFITLCIAILTWPRYPVAVVLCDVLRSTNREKVQRIILAMFRVSDMFLKCTSSVFFQSKISRHDGESVILEGLIITTSKYLNLHHYHITHAYVASMKNLLVCTYMYNTHAHTYRPFTIQ